MPNENEDVRSDAERSVRKWLETFVIEKNLCPFAQRELLANRVRFVDSAAESPLQLIEELQYELSVLLADESIETSLLIHPKTLTDFFDFNDFLEVVDALIVELELEGVFQVASFHPDYRFADTQADDAENYTNRAPYPILHILRESSLESSIERYPDVDQIPVRNITLMNSLGVEELRRITSSFVL